MHICTYRTSVAASAVGRKPQNRRSPEQCSAGAIVYHIITFTNASSLARTPVIRATPRSFTSHLSTSRAYTFRVDPRSRNFRGMYVRIACASAEIGINSRVGSKITLAERSPRVCVYTSIYTYIICVEEKRERRG